MKIRHFLGVAVLGVFLLWGLLVIPYLAALSKFRSPMPAFVAWTAGSLIVAFLLGLGSALVTWRTSLVDQRQGRSELMAELIQLRSDVAIARQQPQKAKEALHYVLGLVEGQAPDLAKDIRKRNLVSSLTEG